MNIIERLHNCPNCGGTLQDDGACRFCGSRVYDFVSIDLENYKPTYLRIRREGKIIIMPVRFDTVSTKWYANDPVLYFDNNPYIAMGYTMPTGELSFTVVGDTIVEDTKVTGSEY